MKLDIKEIQYNTPDSVSLTFSKPHAAFTYKPGQHGLFSFTIDGRVVSRNYSFTSSPYRDAYLSITVRLIEGGLVSNHLFNNKTASIELDEVAGDFHLQPSINDARHLIMFAGGSGITPIMSMIHAILDHEPLSVISLVYVNKFFDRIIFRNELDQLASQFSGRLTIYHILTREKAVPLDYPIFYRDRLSRLVLKKLVKNIIAESRYEQEFYLCGPYGFMQLVQETLETFDIDKSKVHKEHFFLPDDPAVKVDLNDWPAKYVTLQLSDEERSLLVGSGKSILHAALDNNIQLKYSCTQGQCGTCRAILLKGDVKLRKNHVLHESEINAGQILLCQGFPVTDDVVIKVT